MKEEEREQRLHKEVVEQLDMTRVLGDEEVLEVIDRSILADTAKEYLSVKSRKQIRRYVFNRIRRLDVLQELLDDESITEIMVNGPKHIFIERGGKLMESGKQFESAEKLNDVIQQIVAKANRVVNEANPIVAHGWFSCKCSLISHRNGWRDAYDS